jgi:hypothetical protein
MITKMVRKYLHGMMVSSVKQIQVSKRVLDNYVSPYKLNNKGSMWTLI